MYETESENVKPREFCQRQLSSSDAILPITSEECKSAGDVWLTDGARGLPVPDCLEPPGARHNHIGVGTNGHYNR